MERLFKTQLFLIEEYLFSNIVLVSMTGSWSFFSFCFFIPSFFLFPSDFLSLYLSIYLPTYISPIDSSIIYSTYKYPIHIQKSTENIFIYLYLIYLYSCYPKTVSALLVTQSSYLYLQNHCRWWLQPWNWKTLTPWKLWPTSIACSKAETLLCQQRSV